MVQRRSQSDRILEGDRIYLNALDKQVIPYSEISLNYLLDDVPLDAKFILESV